MSIKNDLALAYHMGYDDALAKRKPDASKAQVLASYDLATENAKLRELVRDLYVDMWDSGEWLEPYEQRMRELGIEVN